MGLSQLAAASSLLRYNFELTDAQFESYVAYLGKFGKNYNSVKDFQTRAKRFVEVDERIK